MMVGMMVCAVMVMSVAEDHKLCFGRELFLYPTILLDVK